MTENSGEHRSGRPSEPPSSDYYNTKEAADILGRSTETVRKWIREGRLEGGQYVTRAGEPRYHATKASVEAEARRLSQAPTAGEVEAVMQVETQVAVQQVIESLTSEIRHNREAMARLGDQLLSEMRQNREVCASAVKELEELKALQRQTLELLQGVREAERERTEQGQAERRSFWRRLFSP